MCSEHFPNGKKTYENNVPTIFGTQSTARSRKTPTIREFTSDVQVVTSCNTDSPNEQMCSETLPEQNSINTDHQDQLDRLQKELTFLKTNNLTLQKNMMKI